MRRDLISYALFSFFLFIMLGIQLVAFIAGFAIFRRRTP